MHNRQDVCEDWSGENHTNDEGWVEKFLRMKTERYHAEDKGSAWRLKDIMLKMSSLYKTGGNNAQYEEGYA